MAGPLALSWFGVVVWWIVEDMVGKENPSLYIDQIIWRELVASIMLSVCIAAWMIDMPVQERAAEQACGNIVVNTWRSRSPKHWASKMLRQLRRILIAAQVRILQEHIATADNLLSNESSWKHLKEGGALKEAHRDFVFNELPREGRARVLTLQRSIPSSVPMHPPGFGRKPQICGTSDLPREQTKTTVCCGRSGWASAMYSGRGGKIA